MTAKTMLRKKGVRPEPRKPAIADVVPMTETARPLQPVAPAENTQEGPGRCVTREWNQNSRRSRILTDFGIEADRRPLLSQKEEYEIGMRAKHGDEKAVEALVNHNLRLVLHIAFEFADANGDRINDVVQDGCIGLVHAAKTFDPERKSRSSPERNVRFSGYATWWIKAKIREGSRYNRTMELEVPRDVRIGVRRIEAYRRRCAQARTEPKFEDILNLFGPGTHEQRIRAMACMNLAMASIDVPINDKGDTMAALLEDRGSEDAEHDAYVRETLATIMNKRFPELTICEKTIVMARYGFLVPEDGELEPGKLAKINGIISEHGAMSLDDIGKLLGPLVLKSGGGVTRERIRQVEASAMRKLVMPGTCAEDAFYTGKLLALGVRRKTLEGITARGGQRPKDVYEKAVLLRKAGLQLVKKYLELTKEDILDKNRTGS